MTPRVSLPLPYRLRHGGTRLLNEVAAGINCCQLIEYLPAGPGVRPFARRRSDEQFKNRAGFVGLSIYKNNIAPECILFVLGPGLCVVETEVTSSTGDHIGNIMSSVAGPSKITR